MLYLCMPSADLYWKGELQGRKEECRRVGYNNRRAEATQDAPHQPVMTRQQQGMPHAIVMSLPALFVRLQLYWLRHVFLALMTLLLQFGKNYS